MSTFWETILSNALLVSALAFGLAVLGRIWKNPASLHILWILVLVKLFTPPLVTIEVPMPIHAVGESMLRETAADEMPWSVVETSLEKPAAVASSIRETRIVERASQAAGGWQTSAWPVLLAWTWGLGIGVIALVQAYRVFRFRGILRGCQNPTVEMQDMADSIAKRLGLKRVPKILMAPFRLSPMVWRLVGPVRVILPIELFERLDRAAQEAILAHELAHVRRKDHLVRLLELAATTLFWWHPVAWWAARSLRELEEQCCDAIVLDVAGAAPRDYATALVDTLDFLSDRSVIAPMGVTAVRRVVSLTRRIEMLKSHGRTPRLTLGRLLLLALAAAVPMGLTLAMEPPCPIEAPDASGEEVIKMAVVERKPIAIHDLITVLVDESALAASEGEIDRHKKADTEASLKDSALLKGLSLIPDPQSKGDPTLGAEQNKKYRAEGEMETRESVKLSIQCEVITIYPNGLLMLEGSQTLKINSETWETYYHGTFRPEDILPDNSVESRYAFGQRLVKRESGSVHDGYRGGWLQRLLDRYQF